MLWVNNLQRIKNRVAIIWLTFSPDEEMSDIVFRVIIDRITVKQQLRTSSRGHEATQGHDIEEYDTT